MELKELTKKELTLIDAGSEIPERFTRFLGYLWESFKDNTYHNWNEGALAAFSC